MEKMKAKLIKTHNKWWQLWDSHGKCLANTINESGFSHKLSLKNCQAIERGYDLDELADELASKHNDRFTLALFALRRGMELMGDKKFSEDDVKKIIHWSTLDEDVRLSEEEFIQSLQQTEWEVEIEMEVIPDFNSRSDQDGSIFTSNKKEVPKLDADSCLILKRK
jgi:hypothetical protein